MLILILSEVFLITPNKALRKIPTSAFWLRIVLKKLKNLRLQFNSKVKTPQFSKQSENFVQETHSDWLIYEQEPVYFTEGLSYTHNQI